MKLLFDQNLSHRLVESLSIIYPSSSHARFLGFERADDETLWRYARDHEFTIISKDEDFHQRSLLRGFPPKFIWICAGNCSTQVIEKMLVHSATTIQTFCDDTEQAFLILLRVKED